MSDFSFTRNGTDVGLILEILDGKIEDTAAALVMKAAQHVVGTIREVVYETFPDGRTGALARSFRPTFLGRVDGGVSAAAKSELVYARIQDEGGTVVPKTVKNLAIPLSRTPVGKWPRHFAKGELTLIPGKGGKASILARVKRGKVEPMFVLVRSVRIPGRGYLATAAERAAEGVEEIMAEGYEKLVTKTVEETPGAAGGAGG